MTDTHTVEDLKAKLIDKLYNYLDNTNLNALEMEVITRMVTTLERKEDPVDKNMKAMLDIFKLQCTGFGKKADDKPEPKPIDVEPETVEEEEDDE